MSNSILKCVAFAAVVTVIGCGSDPKGPVTDPTATLSGVVRDAAPSAAPIAGATITAASRTAMSGTDGRFEISGVPIGSAITISVSAPGFDGYSQAIAVQAGQNSHNVALTRKTIYELAGKTLYLPPGVALYRGVIFDMPGSTADSRPLVRGDLAVYQDFPLYGNVAGYRQRLMQFAAEQQFAVMGTATFTSGTNNTTTYDAILASLVTFATETGHPELAHAPLLLYGHSLGGCVAYAFTRLHSSRVIGMIVGKSGSCISLVDAAGAKSVPAYLLMGEEDLSANNPNFTNIFETNRAEGAPWALATEPGANHTRMNDFNLLFNWITTIVALRLPTSVVAGQPVQLRAIDAASGWLGNRTSFAIARDACYPGNKLGASWLPSEVSARNWQALSSGGSVTTMSTC